MIAPAPDDLARLLDAYRHATHYGSLPHATHRYCERNLACGDSVTVELDVGTDSTIQHAAYSGGLCAVAVASASALCTQVEQHPAQWLASLTPSDFLAQLPYAVPRQRIACASLPLQAAQKALAHPL